MTTHAREYFAEATGIRPCDLVEFQPTTDESVTTFMGEGERADLLRAYLQRSEGTTHES